MENRLPWYRNKYIISLIGLGICILVLMNQCSMNGKIKDLQIQNEKLVKDLNTNTEVIRNFETIVKMSIEQQFTQNLLYTDQLNRKQITSQDVVERLNDLNKKLNSIKKETK